MCQWNLRWRQCARSSSCCGRSGCLRYWELHEISPSTSNAQLQVGECQHTNHRHARRHGHPFTKDSPAKQRDLREEQGQSESEKMVGHDPLALALAQPPAVKRRHDIQLKGRQRVHFAFQCVRHKPRQSEQQRRACQHTREHDNKLENNNNNNNNTSVK